MINAAAAAALWEARLVVDVDPGGTGLRVRNFVAVSELVDVYNASHPQERFGPRAVVADLLAAFPGAVEQLVDPGDGSRPVPAVVGFELRPGAEEEAS